MPFEKGRAKTGGRQKGITNLIAPKSEVRLLLEAHNFDVIKEFLENLKHYPHNPLVQNAHLLKLMEFVYAKPKQGFEFSKEEIIDIAKVILDEDAEPRRETDSTKALPFLPAPYNCPS